MKVKELIAKLQTFDPELPVYLPNSIYADDWYDAPCTDPAMDTDVRNCNNEPLPPGITFD